MEAEMEQLLAENAALKARAAPHVNVMKRRGMETLARLRKHETVIGPAPKPSGSSDGVAGCRVLHELQAAERDLVAVIELQPDDQRVQNQLQEVRRLIKAANIHRGVRAERPVAGNICCQPGTLRRGDKRLAAASAAAPPIKKLSVADIRKIGRDSRRQIHGAAAAVVGGATAAPSAAELSSSAAAPPRTEPPQPPAPHDDTADFSADQLSAFDAITRGENCFLTGPAGSGKSFVLRRAVAALRAVRKQHPPRFHREAVSRPAAKTAWWGDRFVSGRAAGAGHGSDWGTIVLEDTDKHTCTDREP
jgi:hypothetical protein